MRLAMVADLDPDRARQALTKVGWPVIEQGVECGAVTAVGA
jgi:hypothetical protein